MEKELLNSVFESAVDEIIDSYDYSINEKFYLLIVQYLCGEIYFKEWGDLPDIDKQHISTFIELINNKSLNWAQFNELLLMVEQDRINEDFFIFLWGLEINKDNFLKGIKKFRLISLLCFGNFRFAYKELSKSTKDKIDDKLKPFSSNLNDEYYKKRPEKAIDINHIDRGETHFVGQITGNKIKKEGKYFIEDLNSLYKTYSENELNELRSFYKESWERFKIVQQKAFDNTNIYLTWDYIDVYVATSMRNSWEYEEAYDLIKNVLNSKTLENLKLRYFDPTQSFCPGRINKGIVEGLMLKRAKCTIYMVQEYDTMGKDSELAATLAQGKPVIAYLPEIKIENQIEKINKLPLSYLENRIIHLSLEKVLTDPNYKSSYEKIDNNFLDIINNFNNKFKNENKYSQFSLWTKKDEKFKKEFPDFQKLSEIIAVAEQFNFKKKADILNNTHPLSLQLNLKSGVANGLLVVRNYEKCINLLYNLLTNNLKFHIKEFLDEDCKNIEGLKEEEKYVTILEESISESAYRVITNYEKLSNSFWNFYLNSSE